MPHLRASALHHATLKKKTRYTYMCVHVFHAHVYKFNLWWRLQVVCLITSLGNSVASPDKTKYHYLCWLRN
jgi:hypothetical protein